MVSEGFDGDASVVPPLALDPNSLGGFADVSEVTCAVALLAATTQRLQLAVANAFEVPASSLKPAGVLASRLRPPPPPHREAQAGPTSAAACAVASSRVGYWNPHVDKANRCLYDFSAVLYLNAHGEDFVGGRFVFLDRTSDDSGLKDRPHPVSEAVGGDAGGADRSEGCRVPGDISTGAVVVARSAVEPRAGRLVAFSSGCENVHHVRMTAVACGSLCMLFRSNGVE